MIETWMESARAAAILERRINPSADFSSARARFAGFCIYRSTSVHQFRAVVVAFLKENPKIWQEPASFLVRKALKEAFPCRD